MKQLILTFGLAIASVVTFAQDAAKTAANPNAPKFQFKDKGDTYDFGTIPEGPVAEHVFEFKNAGCIQRSYSTGTICSTGPAKTSSDSDTNSNQGYW